MLPPEDIATLVACVVSLVFLIIFYVKCVVHYCALCTTVSREKRAVMVERENQSLFNILQTQEDDDRMHC